MALEYADATTDTARDVDDALFARVREHYDEEQIAEFTMLIAWENASSRLNRALRVPSAELWKPTSPQSGFGPTTSQRWRSRSFLRSSSFIGPGRCKSSST